jgi:integrase
MSLLTGARTEELRALHWHEVDLNGRPNASPPIPPSVAVYRSIRAGGGTKTVKSRRRLAMPQRCIDALRRHRDHSPHPPPDALVFATANGTALDAHNVRRSFRRVIAAAGLNPAVWTPANSATASCPCSRRRESASRTSPAWSDTAAPP